MIYLIGGSARCGKTTLAQSLLKRLDNAAYLSGDALRKSVKPLMPEFHDGGTNADNEKSYIDYYVQHTDVAVKEARSRSDLFWPFIERYIDAFSHGSSQDLIIDSVDIWPHLVQDLSQPFKTIYLVDTDSTQWNKIKKYPAENDWMHSKGLSDEQIKAWAIYNAPRSQAVVDECIELGCTYIDVAHTDFESAQRLALDYLLK